jgi:hypothetical protein
MLVSELPLDFNVAARRSTTKIAVIPILRTVTTIESPASVQPLSNRRTVELQRCMVASLGRRAGKACGRAPGSLSTRETADNEPTPASSPIGNSRYPT